MKDSSVWIVAGGTGGHISPGLALAEIFLEKKINLQFLSLEKNRNNPGLKKLGDRVHFYFTESPSLKRLVSFFLNLYRAFKFARSLLKSSNATCVIGLGGFSMVPAILAAKSIGIPIFLCEQNAVAGKATRLFGFLAKRVFLTFPNGLEKRAKYKLVGNPIRKALLDIANNRDKKKISRLETILVLGGSQGAKQINEMIQKTIPMFPYLSWLVQCGESHIDSMHENLGSYSSVKLFGFYENIHKLYDQADLIICRSGAGIITEAALFGLPMVLIPFPYAADGHQLANARIFETGGAARVIDQIHNDPALLVEWLSHWVKDATDLRNMAKASADLANSNAASSIAEEVMRSIS